jgi:GNAT superfamily N-acetyltransferase
MDVRLIRPTDLTNYLTILERTSEEDRYYRFHHVVDAFEPAGLRRFVEDRPDMLGVIAFENGEPLGTAHAALVDERSAEFAIVVAEGARRRGVGRALALALVAELEARGYSRFVAHALRDNVGFTHLAHSLGLHIEKAEGSEATWVHEAGTAAAFVRR